MLSGLEWAPTWWYQDAPSVHPKCFHVGRGRHPAHASQSASLPKQAWLFSHADLTLQRGPHRCCGVQPFLTTSLLTSLQNPTVPHSTVCNFCQLLMLLPVSGSHFLGRVRWFPVSCSLGLTSGQALLSGLSVCLQAKHWLVGLCNHPFKDYLLHGYEMVYVARRTFWDNRKLQQFISPSLENWKCKTCEIFAPECISLKSDAPKKFPQTFPSRLQKCLFFFCSVTMPWVLQVTKLPKTEYLLKNRNERKTWRGSILERSKKKQLTTRPDLKIFEKRKTLPKPQCCFPDMQRLKKN